MLDIDRTTQEFDDFVSGIERRAKDTVGFIEASDQTSYLTGVRTAATFAWESVVALQDRIAQGKHDRDVVLRDMGIIVQTLNKYQHQDE
jgi:hypothetical protein